MEFRKQMMVALTKLILSQVEEVRICPKRLFICKVLPLIL